MIQNANASATLSSGNLAKLRIDFYESGIGDTIIVTFPSGGIGIVDAHPSNFSQRPDIRELVADRTVHFVCLTHPHADHGRDLIPVLTDHPQIEAFWSTIYDIPAFIYGVGQTTNFPSSVSEFAAAMNQDWGEFLIDLFGAVAERRIPRSLLRSDQRERIIDGVEVHCIGPEESVQNSFTDAYREKLTNPASKVPDPNALSAILVLKFGQSTVLLGADALRENWGSAGQRYRSLNLPRALVFKVPHHGAENSFDFRRRGTPPYLDLCSRNPKAKSVLFAGDAKHPHAGVYDRLRTQTDVFCLANGRRRASTNTNPLRIQIPGARAVQSSPVCNPVVSFELDTSGNVIVLSGSNCNNCPLAPVPTPPAITAAP